MLRNNSYSRELYAFDFAYLSETVRYIAGVDEVGRGALAGPVLACAVVLDYSCLIDGVNDSKKLSPAKREAVYSDLFWNALAIESCAVDNRDVDVMNVARASEYAMCRAVDSLQVPVDMVLVDALYLDLEMPTCAIVRADQKSAAVAAASIVAKVRRDALMCEYHRQLPQYAFDQHKGYPTRLHLQRLDLYGVSAIHRRSYAPVKTRLSLI